MRDGRQPATDPDQLELEEIGEGVRYYGREEQRTTLAGRPVLVTLRMTKTLVDGSWERALARESVRYLDGTSGLGTQQVSADSGL